MAVDDGTGHWRCGAKTQNGGLCWHRVTGRGKRCPQHPKERPAPETVDVMLEEVNLQAPAPTSPGKVLCSMLGLDLARTRSISIECDSTMGRYASIRAELGWLEYDGDAMVNALNGGE